MDIRNCKRCSRIFQYRGNKYCHSCILELDEIFIQVRDYIYDHPNATVIEVSDELDVDEDIILDFLKEGRLELSSPGLDYVCERCKKPIVTGRFCNLCIEELNREMKKGLSKPAMAPKNIGKDSKRMYTADYREKKRRK